MEIPLKSILLTKPIVQAVKGLNPSADLKGMKMDPGFPGLPLSRIDQNKDSDTSTMPPIDVKKVGSYFSVVNGRHRVAISLSKGIPTIPANIQEGGAYLPKRYFSGLSDSKKTQRKKEIFSRSKLSWKSSSAYKPFKTDKGVKTRTSGYTQTLKRKFPGIKGLRQYSQKTGVPYKTIKQSYNRGMAAWRTGHRPGATQQQWGYARAASMLVCGKTHYTTDADLVREAKKTRRARTWFKKMCGEK